MKIVFATNTTRQASEILNKVGAEDRLLSYWYLKTCPPNFLAEYVKNGVGPTTTVKGRESEQERVKLEER
jgi:hypothetical protein